MNPMTDLPNILIGELGRRMLHVKYNHKYVCPILAHEFLHQFASNIYRGTEKSTRMFLAWFKHIKLIKKRFSFQAKPGFQASLIKFSFPPMNPNIQMPCF